MARSRRKKKIVDNTAEELTAPELPEIEQVEVKMKKETKKPESILKKPAAALKAETFDQWWLKAQRKHDFKASLKESLAIYFKQNGYMQSKNFDEGLKKFGY